MLCYIYIYTHTYIHIISYIRTGHDLRAPGRVEAVEGDHCAGAPSHNPEPSRRWLGFAMDSMDQWLGLREKSTGNHRFSHEIWGFPVNLPSNICGNWLVFTCFYHQIYVGFHGCPVNCPIQVCDIEPVIYPALVSECILRVSMICFDWSCLGMFWAKECYLKIWRDLAIGSKRVNCSTLTSQFPHPDSKSIFLVWLNFTPFFWTCSIPML